MRAAKKQKKKANWPVRILLVLGAAYLFVKMVQIHMQIQEQSLLLEEMNANIATATVINEDLAEQIAHSEDNRERQANEAGWYYSGQQIYQSAAG